MFRDNSFAQVWVPDEKTRLAVLVACADVDARFSARCQFALSFEFCCLFENGAMSAESFEVFERRSQVRV